MLRTVHATVREEHISMTTTTRILILTLIAGAGSEARAQVPAAPPNMGFVNVNVGAQAASRSVEVNNVFPLYGENATVNTSQSVGSGALFDISAGYHRVWRTVTAAIGFSNFSKSNDVTGTASIPNPLATNRPATVGVSQTGLHHSERTIHLQALWLFPVTNEFDVTFAVGPSIFHVNQEIISVTVPPGTQTVTPSVGSESKTTVGVNIQVDGNYMLTRRLGAGVFMRYAGAKVDLPSVEDLHVGGLHVGGGVRVRF
jgi:hypothetical protein